MQVDGTVQSLSEQYDGPQPSDLCDLLEGEQFFAGFERGLDISTGLRSSRGALFPISFRSSPPHSLMMCCYITESLEQVPGRNLVNVRFCFLQRDQTVWEEDCVLCFTLP